MIKTILKIDHLCIVSVVVPIIINNVQSISAGIFKFVKNQQSTVLYSVEGANNIQESCSNFLDIGRSFTIISKLVL